MAGYCRECGAATTERDADGRMRPVCTGCGAISYLDPKLAVAVVIADGDRILLGRRGAGTRNPGCWSFPAGFVERGERVEDAARREVREEAGVAVCLGPLLGLWSETGEAVVLVAYAASRGDGTPSPGDDLEEVAWFGLDELPELAFGHDRDIIAAWRTSGCQ